MVNDMISYFAIAEAPHGGCKLSGWGRTHGEHGLLEMVQTKYIDVDRLPTPRETLVVSLWCGRGARRRCLPAIRVRWWHRQPAFATLAAR